MSNKIYFPVLISSPGNSILTNLIQSTPTNHIILMLNNIIVLKYVYFIL
jgi:hypothetical protein